MTPRKEQLVVDCSGLAPVRRSVQQRLADMATRWALQRAARLGYWAVY